MDLISTAQLLGNFGEFVGAIAVVGTLFYLAVQVRNGKEATEANTRSLQLHSYTAWESTNLHLNMTMSNPAQSEIIAIGSSDTADLTDETWLSFALMYIGLFQIAQSTDYLYRSGALDRELWEAEMIRIAGILNFPGVRQMWDAGLKKQLTQRFVELLESTQSNIVPLNWDSERGFYQDG